RRLLAATAAAAVAVAGSRGGDAATKKNKGRKRCHIKAGDGVCVNEMCAVPCKKARGCNAVGGSLHRCGPKRFGCGCAKLLNGKTACIVPIGGAELCSRPSCASDADCGLDSGQACVVVPGCCADRTQVCAFACQSQM